MASTFSSSPLLLLPAFILIILSSVPHRSAGADAQAMRMTIINQCDYPVWPAIVPSRGFPQLRGGGCKLETGDTLSFLAFSAGWSGTIWARTNCRVAAFGTFTCATGDCGPSLGCVGRAGTRPYTVAQLAVDGSMQMTYYVNIVEGFNCPMAVVAVGGRGTCPVAGCDVDLTTTGCTAEQTFYSPAVGGGRQALGCVSICPGGLGPCEASTVIKRRCPNIIAYSGDQAAEVMSCEMAREVQVVFCPRKLGGIQQVVSS